MISEFKKIRFWREDDVGIIVPNALEAELDIETASEMLAVLISTAQDKEVRSIVITNQGDQTFFKSPTLCAKCKVEEYVQILRSLVLTLKGLEKNIIMAVNGNCEDVGTELALSGDFLFVRNNVIFSFEKLKNGYPLILTTSALYLNNKILTALLLGERIKGEELYNAGIAHGLSESSKFYDAVKAFHNKIPAVFLYDKKSKNRDFQYSYSDPYLENKIVETIKNYKD